MKRFSIIALAMMLALMGAVMVQAQETATPEPTAEATTDSAQATAEPTVEVTPAPLPVMVRVAHWAPDAPAVDVYVDGAVAVSGATYPSITGYMPLDAGTHSIAIAPAGTALDQAVVGPLDVELTAGAYVTISAVGSSAGGTLKAVVAVDDFSPIPFGSARILAYHAVEGAGNVDVFAGENAVITELGFPGSFTDLNGALNDGAFAVDVPAGTYDISVRATENSAVTGFATAEPAAEATADSADTTATAETPVPGLVDLAGVVLEPGTVYTLAVIGSADAPTAFTTSTAGIVAPLPTALDVALGSPEFSILAAAINAADPSIAAALSGEGDFTVFAPTNAAFDAFLNDMALTTDDLFADTELLNAVLRYHVVSGRTDFDGLTVLNGQTLASLQGEAIGITVNETGGVVLNGSVNVVSNNVAASNGIVHVIDGVLIPPTLASAG